MNSRPVIRLCSIKYLSCSHKETIHTSVKSFAVDSRSCQAGGVFFAIEGKQSDGHHYVSDALNNGALVAVVQRPVNVSIPQIVVKDTQLALLQLAVDYYKQLHLTSIAITGSAGKTSTKNILCHLLESYGYTYASPRSYNNRIGVALTLLALQSDHQFLILEFGTSNVGEIAELTEMIQPDRRILLGASEAHLDGLGSLEGVVQEKGCILQSMQAGQKAIINEKSPYYERWKLSMTDESACVPYSVNGSRIGISQVSESLIDIRYNNNQYRTAFNLIGKHQLDNLSAALTCIASLDLDVGQCVAKIASLKASDRRLELKLASNGLSILDDSYNANLASWTTALRVLQNYHSSNKVIVMSDLDGLGLHASRIHETIVNMMDECGVTDLITLGDMSRAAANKCFASNSYHCSDFKSAIDKVSQLNPEQTLVLIKASRCYTLDSLVDQLLESAK